MTGSTYAPPTWNDVEASKIKPAVIGVQASITAGQVITTDTLVANDVFIRSIQILANNSAFGDTVTLQIVDVAGTYFPAGTVLGSPVSNFVLGANQNLAATYDAIAPMKLLGGLTLRCIYTSTGMTNVNLGLNFLLAQVLI